MSNCLSFITGQLAAAIGAHAAREAPREACGVLLRSGAQVAYWPIANTRQDEGQFHMDPVGYALAEDDGEVLAIVHSHPGGDATPSMADRVMCEASALPWVVMGWPSGQIRILEPSGWEAPYEGREFSHAVLDCYTLLQDWFRREHAILLSDYERADAWWAQGQDLYMQHFEAEGFRPVAGPLQAGDAVLMAVQSAGVVNHAGIVMPDGQLLHHMHSRRSVVEPYDGLWLRSTAMVVRHLDLMPA